MNDHGLVVRPPLGSRVLNVVVPLGFAAFVFILVLSAGPEPGATLAEVLIGSTVCLLPGVYIAIRGYRVGVAVTPGTVKITGILWSRTVPRRSVAGIGEIVLPGRPRPVLVPTLRWKRASGRVRASPIMALANNYGHPLSWGRELEDGLARLKRLLAEHDREG